MSNTTNLEMPFLEAAQAQKHVTLNEALQVLDGVVQLSVLSASVSTPPADPEEGDRYLVAPAASGVWSGHDHAVAVRQDGVWAFHQPKPGWRAHVQSEHSMRTFLGGRWRAGVVLNPFGAATVFEAPYEEHALALASTSDTSLVIPARSLLLGVTALVTVPVTGATSFSVGLDGEPQKFGDGIGTGLNSQLNGPITPTVYYSDTPLRFSAQGGDFTGGTIQVSVHLINLQIPDFQ